MGNEKVLPRRMAADAMQMLPKRGKHPEIVSHVTNSRLNYRCPLGVGGDESLSTTIRT